MAPCLAGATIPVLPLATSRPRSRDTAHPSLPLLRAAGCAQRPARGWEAVDTAQGWLWLVAGISPPGEERLLGQQSPLPGTAGGRGERTRGRQPRVRHPAPALPRQRGNQPKSSPRRTSTWVHAKFTRGALLHKRGCFSARREPSTAGRARMGALGSTSLLLHQEVRVLWGHPLPCSWEDARSRGSLGQPLGEPARQRHKQGEQH